jgi:hypothetical protein
MPANSHGSAIAVPRGASASSRMRRDERRPVLVAVPAALVAAVLTAIGGGVVAGPAGVRGAVVGSSLVLVLFGLGAALTMWAGRRGPSALIVAAGLGVSARLMLYAVVLLGLDATDLVHRPSLAAAVAVTFVITLAGEMAVLARTPSLYRLQVPPSTRTAPSAPGPPPDPTRPDTTPDRAEPLTADQRTLSPVGPPGPAHPPNRSTTQ